ncbi:MAG: RNA methyltransferase [Erysipelotrichaceae bacterium]|nr:RNA methyltransferase [Erysipelotrichaceae bacterium]MDY6035193.1 RNA methyltransferase [Bulleidia sp.]
MEKITSLQNAKVKSWMLLHKKKHRDEKGLFLVEGEHLIQEALAARAVELIITDTASPFDFENVVIVTPAIMSKLSLNVSDVHLIAVCRQNHLQIKEKHRLLLLDGVQDPGNLGTLIRTAVSFGFDGVYCSADTCDLYNDKAIRSTQGALFHIPVVRKEFSELLPELKKDGVMIIATSLQDSTTMKEIKPVEKMAFVLGNEGQGVRDTTIQQADRCLRIEMEGFESLNVAVAGGIIMYQYRR